VLLYGDGLNEIKNISVSRICNKKTTDKPGYITVITPAAIPTEDQIAGASEAVCGKKLVEVKMIQQNDQSVKFVVPEDMEMGVYSVIVETADSKEILYINAPAVKWVQGDIGECASPNGWLRICGEKLSIDGGETSVVLEKDGKFIPMEITRVYDAYSVEIKIPENFEVGSYKVYLTNGFGGDTAWSMPVEVKIALPEVMPDKVFNVRDFGAVGTGLIDDTEAVKAALEASKENGGGVVYFPRGRYKVTDSFDIPNYTTLKGESVESTQIFWVPFKWDFGSLPDCFLSAESDATLEDIEFRGTRVFIFFDFGRNTPNSKNLRINRVSVSFNPYSGTIFFPSTELAQKAMDEINYQKTYFKDPSKQASLFLLSGDNISITDSYFYSPQTTFLPQKVDCINGVGEAPRPLNNFYFKGNTVKSRYDEGAFFGFTERVIMEDNDFDGCTVGNAGVNFYFARNYIHGVLHYDREAYTTDMSYSRLGFYPSSVNGCEITFDPLIKLINDRTQNPGLNICNGKGAGQSRAIVKVEGNVITVSSPFASTPDETSEFNYGGTIRYNCYLVNNRTFDAGHMQFFVDQNSSVFDGNEIYKAGGLFIFGWRCPRNSFFKNDEVDEDKYRSISELDYYTVCTFNFISFVNNKLKSGNHFHYYGENGSDHFGYPPTSGDCFSGYSVIGANVSGIGTSIRGVLYKNNELSNNSIFLFRHTGTVENAIFETNIVQNSDYGFKIDCPLEASYMHNNDTSKNVDTPYCIAHNDGDTAKILIEN